MNEKIQEIENKIDSILDALKESAEIRTNNGIIIDNNFQILNSKIENLSSQLSSLHKDQLQGFDEVKMELVKIQKTIPKE